MLTKIDFSKFTASAILMLVATCGFAQNPFHFNSKPLKQDVWVQLPLGSIKAKGWLLKQLEQQRDGATGMAEELYPEKDNLGKDTDWLGGTGSSWERVPYYVKGLIALAYTLDDPALKAKAQKYIDWTLKSQQSDGLFGPPKMNDWWPRMPMMYALQGYYEATGDKRVVPFLTKYLKYELAQLDKNPLRDWGKARAADNMEIALWLYNINGDQDLLSLVNKLKGQAYPWVDIFNQNQFFYFGEDFHPKHMVNVAQALKFPAIVGQLNDTKESINALGKGLDHLSRDHGQPQGLSSGTEFLAGRSSIQGVETCTVVEWMQSMETATRVIQDVALGDELEKVAFNALPAQFDREFKRHAYYTLPNQVQSVHGENGFNQDYTNGVVLSPQSGFGCCRYNMHMGWPYFVKNSVAATPEKGLAFISYGPMEIETIVADGQKIKISEVTNYPFEEAIKLNISLSNAARFPLLLRIPAWAVKPSIKVNGLELKGVKSGSFYSIAREWKDQDQVVINFPMEITSSKQVNNSTSIERGPIVYALEIKSSEKITKKNVISGFNDMEILPASPWNYGLVIKSGRLDQSFAVERGNVTDYPFTASATPIKLKAKGRRIPSWGLSAKHVAAAEVPFSPVFSNEQDEEITLVPFGSENIRLTCFPVIGKANMITENLSEQFDKGMPANWVFYGGGWYQKDGEMHVALNSGSFGSGIRGSKIVANQTAFDDFTYQANIKVNTAGDAGLIFRVTNQAIGPDAYDGYYVGLNPDKGVVEIGKAVDQKWVVIKEEKYPLELNKMYNVKVSAKGSEFAVFLDDSVKPTITATDTTYRSGSIGFRAYNALASFDMVKVNPL
ncbi:beta-L-arabinofuranosidase domain-containing protein [Pedobacter sandarakinus]|uniref:beta-L-arabinofuranosidase domain-containing protein n=1 Tax=Pedobacter sandarakinus TaxID=353156 RepID=UPI0022462AE8|nr:beta-L-arabinofuranosidase domain-containing protein [Pedobacter sandarakinus]MCX2575172.1 glycoside hydrolase family 127 protein [Pedobacter sandarakinus]